MSWDRALLMKGLLRSPMTTKGWRGEMESFRLSLSIQRQSWTNWRSLWLTFQMTRPPNSRRSWWAWARCRIGDLKQPLSAVSLSKSSGCLILTSTYKVLRMRLTVSSPRWCSVTRRASMSFIPTSNKWASWLMSHTSMWERWSNRWLLCVEHHSNWVKRPMAL